MHTQSLKETSLYVADLELAEKFYVDIMDFQVMGRVGGERMTLQYGDSTLVLFRSDSAHSQIASGTASPHNHGHASIGIRPSEVASWRAHLERHQVPIESESVWPNGDESITCCDPAGNRIELKTQSGRSDDITGDERASQGFSSGLHAQWKIYQAAKLAVKDDASRT